MRLGQFKFITKTQRQKENHALRKKIQITSALLFFMSLSVMAEGIPKVELFGGYSLFHQIKNNIIERRGKNANGWNGSASLNLNNWLAFQTDISAHYFLPETNSDRERTSTTSINNYRVLFGPKFTIRVTDKLSSRPIHKEP